MDAPRFINALRIMWNLDRHHLVEAGVLDADDKHGWEVFRDYPHDAAIRLGDERAARLWTLVESRQKDRVPADPGHDSAPDILVTLNKAEAFIRGFEDDESQEGIAELLAGLRAAIAKVETMWTMLCESRDAWDDEEDSVKVEHAELIADLSEFLDGMAPCAPPAIASTAAPLPAPRGA